MLFDFLEIFVSIFLGAEFTEPFCHELHEWTLMFLCSIFRANS